MCLSSDWIKMSPGFMSSSRLPAMVSETKWFMVKVVLVVVMLISLSHGYNPRYDRRSALINSKNDYYGEESRREQYAAEEPQTGKNSKFDMILLQTDDQHPAESMHYQTFAEFHDISPEIADDNMDESAASSDWSVKPYFLATTGRNQDQFVDYTAVRAPQATSQSEKKIRRNRDWDVDPKEQRYVISTLRKGSTQPRRNKDEHEAFDYDQYDADPSKSFNG